MPTTDQDARALTYFARRLREDTYGACEWDEAGTYAIVSRLVGQQLSSVIERVTRHAADPEAKTPGAINRPFVPAAAGPQAPRNPKPAETCGTCGNAQSPTCCDKPSARPEKADGVRTPDGWADGIRAAMRGGVTETDPGATQGHTTGASATDVITGREIGAERSGT